jgi:hypothetical protein
MRLAALAVIVTSVACGDNIVIDDRFEAASGARMKLVGYIYEDGTRQWEPQQLSDTALHVRCTPERWIDGVTRCVPIADDAVYTDAACTMVAGRARMAGEPRVFVQREWVDDAFVAAHVYRAGEIAAELIDVYYVRRDGACDGPYFDAGGTTYDVLEEIGDIVEVQQVAVGDSRVEMRLRITPDGLRVPLALYDRELHTECRPPTRPEAGVECEPVDASPGAYYRDPDCADPAVLAPDPEVDPRAAAVVDGAGCARFHAIGAEVRPPLYILSAGVCTPTATGPAQRWFAVAEPLALAPLARSVEAEPGRRLQRVRYRDDDLDAVGDLLVDTASRGTCRRVVVGGISRCLPAVTAPVRAVYREGCLVPLRVAERREPACERASFALEDLGGVVVYAIGDPVAEAVYSIGFDGLCRPYASPGGTVLYELGPPLPPETFPAAVLFEDR